MSNNGKQTDRVAPTAGNPTPLNELFTEELPQHTNDKGGKQSDIPGRFDLVPPIAIVLAAKVLAEGAEKYGVDNWKLILAEDHINHAIRHLYLWLDEKDSPLSLNHLTHAMVRVMFAVHTYIQDN